MQNAHLNRFSPLMLRNYRLANRVVVPPMASSTADAGGFVTEATRDHYRRLTRSQAAITMVEYSYVMKSGKSEAYQLGADSDDKIPALRTLATVIRQSQSVSIFQLTHSLAKSSPEFTGENFLGASAIAVPVKDREMPIPREATLKELVEIQEAFVSAARRVYLSGFQGVELHAAHGYGMNQSLSPITNQRRDKFGGPLVQRASFLFEIVSRIRSEIPELLLSVRIPGQDNFENGLSLDDMKWVARNLESLGVDLLNVSSGIGGWRRPEGRRGEGYLVSDAAAIQSEVRIPVIVVGGIQSAEFIDESLRSRKFSLAAVGRAILENPENFASKVLYLSA